MASPNTPRGSSAVGKKPAGRKWLVPALLGLVVLIVLILLLSRCGNDDDTATSSSGTPASTAAVAPTTASAQPTTGQSGEPGQLGTVTADGSTLLGADDAAPIKDADGKQVAGTAVKVQSVPADEGFWVGTSTTDRLWVQLTDTHGESDYRVKQGDSINFTGTVKAAAEDYASKAGVTAAEGADQITEQGAYLAVQSSDVKLFE